MCVCVCVGGGVSVKGKYPYKTKEALAKNTSNYLNITFNGGVGPCQPLSWSEGD